MAVSAKPSGGQRSDDEDVDLLWPFRLEDYWPGPGDVSWHLFKGGSSVSSADGEREDPEIVPVSFSDTNNPLRHISPEQTPRCYSPMSEETVGTYEREEISNNLRLRLRVIRGLLQFQRYDGAIDFGDSATAEKWLGMDIVQALDTLSPPGLVLQVLWTAAVCVLLERDFQSCKALWELLAFKANTYLKSESHYLETGLQGADDLLLSVEALLEGLALPILSEGGAAGLDDAAVETRQPEAADGTDDSAKMIVVETGPNDEEGLGERGPADKDLGALENV